MIQIIILSKFELIAKKRKYFSTEMLVFYTHDYLVWLILSCLPSAWWLTSVISDLFFYLLLQALYDFSSSLSTTRFINVSLCEQIIMNPDFQAPHLIQYWWENKKLSIIFVYLMIKDHIRSCLVTRSFFGSTVTYKIKSIVIVF